MQTLIGLIDATPAEIRCEGAESSVFETTYFTQPVIQWESRANARLSVRRLFHTKETAAVKPPFLPGFACKICCKAPSQRQLVFAFGFENKPVMHFTYKLNFEGWKEISIPYTRGFLQGRFRSGMDFFSITAHSPDETSAQTILLTDLALWAATNPLFTYATLSPQIPHMPCHARRFPIEQYERHGIHLNEPVFAATEITPTERAAFATIERTYLSLCDACDSAPYTVEPNEQQAALEHALSVFASYQIRLDGEGEVCGAFITNSTAYAKAMKSIARAYEQRQDESLADAYILMLRHLCRQNTVINWYNGRGVASSVLLMRERLRRGGLLPWAIQFLKRAYEFQVIYSVSSNHGVSAACFEDTDTTGTAMPSLLVCILLMDDMPEKVRDMRHFLYYVEHFCLGLAPGVCSGFKPDGTSFHHGAYIRNYQTVATFSLARLLRMLAGTCFMLSEAACARFVSVLENEYIVYNGAYELFSLSQYHFNAAAPVALCDFADTAIALRHDALAQQYMALAQSSSPEMATPQYAALCEQGVQPALPYEGHKTLTYSAAAIHARAGWKLAVKGFSKYVYSMEIWNPDSGRYCAFPMFRSFGFLELVTPPILDGGVQNAVEIEQGFDFTHWNGTTAPQVPLSQITEKPLVIEDEWAEWLYSDKGFVGGVDTCDGNGTFAMQLHGPHKYHLDTFYANKSYHFLDDFVVCLGSDIECGLPTRAVDTTVFQELADCAVRKGDLLQDSRGNGYYIFPGQSLRFFTRECKSRDTENRRDTSAKRTFAILSHGKMPQNGSYAYLMQVNASLAALETAEPWKRVEILAQTELAHIVRIETVFSYVLYCKSHNLPAEGPIASASESCIIRTKEDGDGTLHLAICDPDLRFYRGEKEDYEIDGTVKEHAIYGRSWHANESMPSVIWLVLRRPVAAYTVQSGNFSMAPSGDPRIIACTCRDGLTNEITLRLI